MLLKVKEMAHNREIIEENVMKVLDSLSNSCLNSSTSMRCWSILILILQFKMLKEIINQMTPSSVLFLI